MVLGLDAQHLAWLRDDQSFPGEVATARHTDGVVQALAGAGPGLTVDVIAASDLALHWVQTPPANVASLSELRLVAGARCAHLYGGSPQDWWVAADWDSTRPFPCAALPRSVVAPLNRRLTQLAARARWHTTWGMLCSARADAFPENGWSAMRSANSVTLWHCREGMVNCLTTSPLDEDATDRQALEWALQYVQIEALRSDALPQGPLHWLDLTRREVHPLPGVQQILLQVPRLAPASRGEAALALSLRCLLEGVGR